MVINHAGYHGGCNLQQSQMIKRSRFWRFNAEDEIFEMLEQSLFCRFTVKFIAISWSSLYLIDISDWNSPELLLNDGGVSNVAFSV